ncbi:MAG: hypothetical protein ACHQ53_14170 [Polyangiales bacterium]
MADPLDRTHQRDVMVTFLALSGLLHVLAFFAVTVAAAYKSPIDIRLPDEIELGVVENNPGAQGSPPPAAPPAAQKPVPPPAPAPKPAPKPASDAIVLDAGAARDAATPTDAAASDAAPASEVAKSDQPPSGTPGETSGEGQGEGDLGAGLGFGSGGFGRSKGGPSGAVIGFHADLDEIRRTSLTLETRGLLELIPEWQKMLQGSGIDPLKDLSRVFVATPSLKRSDLVMSARFVGGKPLLERAVERLAQEKGQSARFEAKEGLEVAPWYNRGPTAREVAVVAPDQFVVARPQDVSRVLGVSAALARRHAKQPDMEQSTGPAALLAMYPKEAVALSVEGAREFVAGDNSYVPTALRISLWHIDEFHIQLRVFGYYESDKRAGAGLERIDELRHAIADHPRVQYLGLRSAIEEAKLERHGDTLTLESVLTLHQTRYLMGFVTEALKPRD